MPVTIAQVLTLLFIHIGVILVVTAYFGTAAAILPDWTERAAVRFGQRPWLAMLVGLLISVPVVVVALILLNLGPVAPLGAVLGLGWLLLGLIGGGAIALHVGRSHQGSPAPAVRGGVLITLTWALPVVGWLVALPLTIATGVGCLVLGLRKLPVGAPAQGAVASGGGPLPDLAMSAPDGAG